MKTILTWMGVCMLSLVTAGCQREEQPVASQPASESMASPAPRVSMSSGNTMPPAAEAGLGGTVLETMDAGKYTYVRLKTDKDELWAAGPQTTVKVGQIVRLVGGMPMTRFESKTLGRTFDSILFVTEIVTSGSTGSAASMPANHPPMGGGHPPTSGARQQKRPVAKAEIKAGSITPAEGGFNVADLYGRKDQLAGQRVALRAQVVKSTPNIMGKNWLHLQDGSGGADNFDLTVTSRATANVGDVIWVSGMLAKDKDVGAGYFFPLIIEDAELKVETPATGGTGHGTAATRQAGLAPQ